MNPRIPSLQHRLFLILGIAALLLSLLFIFLLDRLATRFKADISSRNQTLCIALSGHVETLLRQPLDDFQRFREKLGQAGGIAAFPGPDQMKPLVETNRLVELVQVLDFQGRVLGLQPENPEFLGFDLSNQDFFTAALGTREVFWSNAFISTQTSAPSVTISAGFTTGVLVAQLNLQRLSEMITILGKDCQGRIAVVDRRGVIIAHTRKDTAARRINISNMRAVQLGLAGKSGSMDDVWDGEKGLASAAPIPSSGWSVIVFQPHTRALGVVEDIQAVLLVIFFAGAGSIFFTLFLIFRGVKKNIVQFETRARLLADGRYDTPVTPGFREFETLSGSFNRMAEKIMAREAALRESEEKYRLMVETANEGICFVDKNREFSFANACMARMLGLPPRELQGRKYRDFIFPEDQDFFEAKIARRMQGEIDAYEARFRRHDSSEIWVIYSGAPMFDPKNNYLGSLGMVVDITDRKHTELELARHRNHLEELVRERTRDLAEKNRDLEKALEEIRTLQGIIPICSVCKNIRDDKGIWDRIESYIQKHSGATFSHGMCPSCSDELYGDQTWYIEMKKEKQGKGK